MDKFVGGIRNESVDFGTGSLLYARPFFYYMDSGCTIFQVDVNTDRELYQICLAGGTSSLTNLLKPVKTAECVMVNISTILGKKHPERALLLG